jgi:ankyrin repeat protein
VFVILAKVFSAITFTGHGRNGRGKLVISLGGNVKAANNAGDTALHAAAALGMNNVIQVLVDNGADLNAKNKAGRTPLAVARRNTGVGESVVNERTAALLRKLGAQ